MLLASIAILAGGCSKSIEGSKYNYATGNLSAILSADVQKSYDASLKACEQLELKVSEKSKDALGAKIETKTSADKKITISLTRVNDMTTEIVIEVGMVGDKEISKNLYAKILENLKK
jgi:endo-beta-N-acetylglucosaminidase D